MNDLLTVADVAEVLSVSSSTVRYYERTGQLIAMRTAGGMRLFVRGDVERFVRAREAVAKKKRQQVA